MRIDSQNTIQNDRLSNQAASTKTADLFTRAMKTSQSKLQTDSLNQLMGRVDTSGQKLANQRTIENLMDYKRAVKQFISETVRFGLCLSDEHSQSLGGGMRPQQIIKVIDKKLIAMQEEILNNEKEGIGSLDIVGEVKGLLINLYM